jgi:hypothetical protein
MKKKATSFDNTVNIWSAVHGLKIVLAVEIIVVATTYSMLHLKLVLNFHKLYQAAPLYHYTIEKCLK